MNCSAVYIHYDVITIIFVLMNQNFSPYLNSDACPDRHLAYSYSALQVPYVILTNPVRISIIT